MTGRLLLSTLLAAAWLSVPHAAITARPADDGRQAPRRVAPADAAAFIGDWTLALQGPDGPGTFDLTVKVEKENVVGEIRAETLPKQAITDVSLDKGTLVLGYTFTYEGNPVDAVVSLMPGKEDKVAAQIDFAGGAYVMAGTARKKDAPK